MIVAELLKALPPFITERIPTIRNPGIYAGQFNEASLKNKALDSPGALVACLGFRRVAEDAARHLADRRIVEARFAAYFVSRDPKGEPYRTLEAIGHAESFAAAIDLHEFDIEGVGQARLDRAENGHSEALRALGHVIWPVTWWHQVGLDNHTAIDPATLDDFALFSADYDIDGDGQPEAEDDIKLPGASAEAVHDAAHEAVHDSDWPEEPDA